MTTATRSPEYMDLSPRRQLFVDEIVLDPSNYTQAALRAGYAADSAKQTGSRLMTDNDICVAIVAERTLAVEKSGSSLPSVIARLDGLASGAKADRDKIRALELVGKLLGGFIHRVEHSGSIIHVALPPLSDEDLMDRIAVLRAERDGVALPALEGEARVVEEDAPADAREGAVDDDDGGPSDEPVP